MAQTPTSETVYNTRTLSKWFAIGSLILMVSLVWAVIEDYDRDWKNYSRQSKKILAAQAEFRMKVTNAGIDPKKVETLEKQISEIQAEQRRVASEIDDMISRRQASFYALNQKYQTNKGELDALQYQMEHAIGGLHEHAAHDLRAKFEESSRKVAAMQAAADAAERSRDEALARKKDFLSEQKKVEDQLTALLSERGRLDKIIFQNDTNVANLLRNAPVVDFVAPTVKIDQVVLAHVKDDYFFNKVPRVDRCMTCHATADKTGFEDFPQPFKTHPKLDLMVGALSRHPIEKVGCTSCHAGVPQSVDFSLAAHTPRNAAQEEEWLKKYNYHRSNHIGTPMVPLQMTEGKCIQCHANQIQLAGAPTFNTGMRLIERYGCYTCHKFQGYFEELAKQKKPAPSLTRIASKVNATWIQKWLWDPKSFRPTTLMPSFWKNHNNSDVESLARSAVEIESITHFIVKKSTVYTPVKLASDSMGEAARGKTLVGTIGCLGCHAVKDFPRSNPKDDKVLGWRDPRLPNFAPELNQMGSKVSREWMLSWLINPKHYDEGTAMPSMKLTNQEASDIATYLLDMRNPTFEALKAPEADAVLRDRMIVDTLEKTMAPKDAQTKLASMSLEDKKMFLGDKLVLHYGCYSCHAIQGFETAPNVGPELTTEGSKDVSKFAFENVKIFEKSRPDWIFTKIRTPRIWDVGKNRAWDAKQKMPHFGFSSEQATALASVIIGFENKNVDREAVFPMTGRWEQIVKAQNLLRQNNCVGCHAIEGRYGEVLAHYQDDPGNGPPNLNSQGRKTQPDWIKAYVANPDVMIRPWVKIRMPQFMLPEQKIVTISQGLSALEKFDSYPYDLGKPRRLSASELADTEKMVDQLGCYTCHVHAKPGQDPAALAPHFENVARRLNPTWTLDWLHDPAKIMPGTRMPTLWQSSNEDDPKAPRVGVSGFFGDDAEKQMEAVRNYLFYYQSRGPSDYPSPREESAPPAAAQDAKKDVPGPTAMN